MNSILKEKTIFNLEELKPGTAINYKIIRDNNIISKNAIIVSSSESYLEVVQFDKDTKNNTFINKLYLRNVLNDKLIIKILK